MMAAGAGVTGTCVLTAPEARVSEASPVGLLWPNNQEVTYL